MNQKVLQRKNKRKMETGDHFKNKASLKSQTSRINLMKKIFAIALVMIVILLMESCSSNSSNSLQSQSQTISINNNLIGAWEGEYNSFLFFFDNGTYYGNRFKGSGRYSIHENFIMLTTVDYNGGESSSLYTFSVSGDTLILLEYGYSEERKVTFKKVKK